MSSTPLDDDKPDLTVPSGHGTDADWEDEFFAADAAPPLAEFSAPTAIRQQTTPPPLSLVESAFLASTASLLWLASYYLSLVPWMRILFPLPAALVYLRWGGRAAVMTTLVTGLLLSVLMGPYLSVLFMLPYGLLGLQLGATWARGMSWGGSIVTGTLLSTVCFFLRIALVSLFLSEDLWVYLTNRIADFVQWLVLRLVDWGILGVGALGGVDVSVIQLFAVGALLLSDLVYVFTIHLAGWTLLGRLGNPIPDPPRWVQVVFED